IVPKPNVWEYLNSSASSLQKSFLQSLNYSYVDSTLATVSSIDQKTGKPILEPGTGVVNQNYFLQKIANVKNEDVKYTYVILTDAAFAAEKAKISKYFQVSNPAVSDSLTNWNIIKDLAFVGDYSSNLPDTLVSVDSVKIHLDPSAIVEKHKLSNGVVYVMSRIDYKMSSKIKPVIIQGEFPVSSAKNAVPYYGSNMGSYGTRTTITRRNPTTKMDFTQLYYYNTGKANYWVHYLPTLNSVAYKVYWVALRDFNTTGTVTYFSQAITFGSPTLLPTLPLTQVALFNYNEVYIGTYTPSSFGKTDTFLVGANSTSNGANSLVLDYIKFVPILN
ncbi:MAG: hypothetical protein Q8904_15410, partial [Bacteroidota bacterium]|nr:hypothetical protein [Bacteroidota bacterium]